jgi:hypothetical protein
VRRIFLLTFRVEGARFHRFVFNLFHAQRNLSGRSFDKKPTYLNGKITPTLDP